MGKAREDEKKQETAKSQISLESQAVCVGESL